MSPWTVFKVWITHEENIRKTREDHVHNFQNRYFPIKTRVFRIETRSWGKKKVGFIMIDCLREQKRTLGKCGKLNERMMDWKKIKKKKKKRMRIWRERNHRRKEKNWKKKEKRDERRGGGRKWKKFPKNELKKMSKKKIWEQKNIKRKSKKKKKKEMKKEEKGRKM